MFQHRNYSLTPSPSLRERGVVTFVGRSLSSRTIYSPLPERGVGGEASIQCQNHFAVASRLEFVLSGEAAAYFLMIVYLAVHGQHLFAVGTV
jgi:hypothetical protein